MEETFKTLAELAALIVESLVVFIVLCGSLFAFAQLLLGVIARAHPVAGYIRRVWLRFAAWILVSLEFALGADIIRTAIAPTWDDIGKLAAIAGIRTFLGFFLDRDMKSIEEIGSGVEGEPIATAEDATGQNG